MILVLDASVLIDLCHCRLVTLLKRLGRVVITDFVLNEVKESLPPDFEPDLFFFEDITEILAFRTEHRSLSLPDASVFLCTRTLIAETKSKDPKVILLTGDAGLRALCKISEIPCHGILWVLDQFLAKEIISLEQACKALREILDKGSWLPKEEVRKRLKHWCKSGF